jgi:hypothetical protein
LQISQPTVNRDIGYLRVQARQNLQNHIQDKLPEEYQNCMTGINQVFEDLLGDCKQITYSEPQSKKILLLQKVGDMFSQS